MRISKWHLVVCVTAFCGSLVTVTVRADGNPAQAAALAALEAKMSELNAQSAPTNAAPASTPAAATTTRPSAPAMSARPSSHQGLFAPVPPPSGSAPATAARQNAPSAAAAPQSTHPPVAATPMPSTPAMKTRSGSQQGLFAPVPPPSSGVSAQALTGQTAIARPVFRKSAPNSSALNAGTEQGFPPIQPPPPPVSPAQVAQLQALLQKYDANAITPEQYQAERAKIMAEHK